ncbi:MAG: TonB-dependent receptor [Woeseiaceae bacterium]|jgi:iron complex outermembrane receptor protein
MTYSLSKSLAVLATTAFIAIASPAEAQDETDRRGGASTFLEEITVTARKRDESMQDAPLSVSAFGSEQIDALQVRDLTSLATGLPNVSLDDVGTTRGVANFSIRGLGITASIPSIDPTVGVFVDGVYMGLNNGIVFDVFDLESIEVLRGPQGILFGRNVTGGAILLNTKKPGDELEFKLRAAADAGGDGGMNTYLMGSVGGPVSNTFAAKLTAYYNDDEGWFKNLATGNDHGAVSQLMVRPVIVWTPTDDLEITARYEYSDIDGDGPSSQSHTNGFGVDGTPISHDPGSFDFAIDEEGFQTNETNFFSMEVDWSVSDTGTITNIFGWRDYDGTALSDIDAQPVPYFHGSFGSNAEQISNELRYNGMIGGKTNLTVGLYYFKNDLEYAESRFLLGGALTQDGGGLYGVETTAAFAALDYDISERFTLIAGLRYTSEEKDAQIATLPFNTNAPCDVLQGTCTYDFVDSKSWTNVSPKLGATMAVSDDATLYAHWTRGFRSGGYNLRNTAGDTVANPPGPFDEETVDNFEFGWKYDFERGRLNGAVFFNQIQDLQADVNFPDPVSAVVQVIKNTADAEILGAELDGVFSLADNFVVTASIGVIDAKYTKVLYDLNGDGVIDDADLNLNLKRAPDLTYSVGFNWDVDLGTWGYMVARASYAHRDETAWSEDNRAYVPEQDIVDAGLSFNTNDDRWVLALYGKNLTNEVKWGGDTQLPSVLGPAPLGGTFSPLAKGRVVGAEVTFSF